MTYKVKARIVKGYYFPFKRIGGPSINTVMLLKYGGGPAALGIRGFRRFYNRRPTMQEYWCDNNNRHPLLQYRGHAHNPTCPLCGKAMTPGTRFALPGTEANAGVRSGYLHLPTYEWDKISNWFWRLEAETEPI